MDQQNQNPQSGCKYYLKTSLDTDEPLVIYKFFSDKKIPPQVISKLHGWQNDGHAWLLLANGEISSHDIITEQKVGKIIASWK